MKDKTIMDVYLEEKKAAMKTPQKPFDAAGFNRCMRRGIAKNSTRTTSQP